VDVTVGDENKNSKTFKKCRKPECTFFVRKEDKTCPNCGTPRPFAPNPTGCGCALLGLTLIVAPLLLPSLGFTAASPRTLGEIAIALICILGINKIRVMAKNPISDTCLNKFEDTIEERISHLEEKRNDLFAVQGRLINEDDKKWLEARTIVAQRLNVVAKQISIYRLKELEIKILRWQNSLKPSIDSLNFDEITQTEAEVGIKEIDGYISGARHYIKQISDFEESEERESAIKSTEEFINTCNVLRDRLIAREAVVAIQGTGTLQDALNPVVLPNSLLNDHYRFMTEASFKDFSDSFKQLEIEYKKLQVEDDTSAFTSGIVNEASKLLDQPK